MGKIVCDYGGAPIPERTGRLTGSKPVGEACLKNQPAGRSGGSAVGIIAGIVLVLLLVGLGLFGLQLASRRQEEGEKAGPTRQANTMADVAATRKAETSAAAPAPGETGATVDASQAEGDRRQLAELEKVVVADRARALQIELGQIWEPKFEDMEDRLTRLRRRCAAHENAQVKGLAEQVRALEMKFEEVRKFAWTKTRAEVKRGDGEIRGALEILDEFLRAAQDEEFRQAALQQRQGIVSERDRVTRELLDQAAKLEAIKKPNMKQTREAAHCLLLAGRINPPELEAQLKPRLAVFQKRILEVITRYEEPVKIEWEKLKKFGKAAYNAEKREVYLKGKFCLHVPGLGTAMEFLIVGRGGKTHEAIIEVDVRPMDVWYAMIVCQYKWGRNIKDVGDTTMPKGDGVVFWVQYQDPNLKKLVRRRLEDFIWDLRAGERMRHAPHIFTGSRIRRDPTTSEPFFEADLEQDICAIYASPAALFNSPLDTRADDTSYALYGTDPHADYSILPPLNTPAEIIIAPAEEPALPKPAPEGKEGKAS